MRWTAFSNEGNINDPHVAQVGFGGDVALQPRPQRLAQEKAKDAKHQRKRDQEESPAGGTRALHRHPGHRRRKERGRDQICSTARMDRKSAFAGAQP